ncbi:hypothetical protein PENSPDRAFT_755953 [Peniophora sp. CONT]|nr:hypothetical protein PENSPDRAFT_755953 [Peniophora sp. CONT]
MEQIELSTNCTIPERRWYPDYLSVEKKADHEAIKDTLKTMRADCIDEDSIEDFKMTVYVVSQPLPNNVPGVHCLIAWPTFFKNNENWEVNGWHCFDLVPEKEYNCFSPNGDGWCVREKWRHNDSSTVKNWGVQKRNKPIAVVNGPTLRSFKDVILKTYSRPHGATTSVNCISYVWECASRMVFLPGIRTLAENKATFDGRSGRVRSSRQKSKLEPTFELSETLQSRMGLKADPETYYYHRYIWETMEVIEKETTAKFDRAYNSDDFEGHTADDQAARDAHGKAVTQRGAARKCYDDVNAYIKAHFQPGDSRPLGLPPVRVIQ